MNGSRSRDEISQAALDAFRARHPGVDSSRGLNAGSPVSVKRLDRPDSYLLVPIQDAVGLRGIVQMDAGGQSVQSSAAIRDPGAVFLASEDAALAAVKAAFPNRAGWGMPFLAWRPCRESFDSMRPFWVVPHRSGQVYVSQSREVFETLTAGRGG
jgi:hypothetical protein